ARPWIGNRHPRIGRIGFHDGNGRGRFRGDEDENTGPVSLTSTRPLHRTPDVYRGTGFSGPLPTGNRPVESGGAMWKTAGGLPARNFSIPPSPPPLPATPAEVGREG